ncbi:unnamed protein product [Closterium sp. NIES-53]
MTGKPGACMVRYDEEAAKSSGGDKTSTHTPPPLPPSPPSPPPPPPYTPSPSAYTSGQSSTFVLMLQGKISQPS